MTDIDYKIIASGSNGNAVRIGNLMFDCGIPFKDMKDELYKCDALLITHTHSDHIKKQTFTRIRKEFPRLKVYANPNVAYLYQVDMVIQHKSFEVGETVITPVDGVHDVPVTYYIFTINDNDIIYATDTCKLFNEEERRFDYFFVESNYDEDKLKQIGRQYAKNGYDPFKSSLRHLSTQDCQAFYYMYRKSRDSQLIELHKSHRFY